MSKPTCRAVASSTYSGGTVGIRLEHAAGETLVKEMKLLRRKRSQAMQPKQRSAAACLACVAALVRPIRRQLPAAAAARALQGTAAVDVVIRWVPFHKS